MAKEYAKVEEALPTGYILEGNIAKTWEHTLFKKKMGKDKDGKDMFTIATQTKNKQRELPAPIADTQLEILIETYLYTYIDRPGAMSIHTTQLLAALMELKAIRESRIQLVKPLNREQLDKLVASMDEDSDIPLESSDD